jgi:hypothetical protein
MSYSHYDDDATTLRCADAAAARRRLVYDVDTGNVETIVVAVDTHVGRPEMPWVLETDRAGLLGLHSS